MIDTNKTTGRLITELAVMHQRINKLEALESKQKRIICELEDSELRYRRLFEAAQDGILILDKATGQIIDVNPFLIDMLGYSKKEFLGKSLWEIGPFKDTEASKVAFQELLEKEYVRYEHLPLETKDKHPISVEFVSNIYSVDHTKVIQCNVRDITDRKRLEAKLMKYRGHLNELMEQRTTELKMVNKHFKTLLAEHKNTEKALVISEDKYHLLVENANEAIVVAQKGIFKFANQKATEISGYSREELMSLPFAKLVHPDDRKMVTERHLKRLQGKELPNNYPFRIIDKNGITRWVEIGAVLITWEGRPATLNLLTEITERKQAEDKLRESARDYRDLAESISDIFFAFDNNLKYIYWNKASEELTGVLSKDALGKHLYDVFPDTEMTRKAEKIYRKVLKTKRSQYFSMEYQVGDKHHFFEMSAYPSKKGISVFAKDITEKKQTEEKLLLGTEKLLRAMQSTIQAISMTVEIRDPYTAGHQHRATKLACAIGKHVGLSEDRIEGLNLAGIVHDIGKIYVPAEILSKPGKLNKNEFAMIKMHPQVGYDILKDIEFPWPIAQIVLQHHERMDGSGYPNGFRGEDIILEARILAVADVVEAMASHRPYRPALGIDKALDEIRQNKGILYDADIVDACVELFTEKGFKFE